MSAANRSESSVLRDVVPSSDFSKEVGVTLITAWFYTWTQLSKRVSALRSVPPVLSSTVCMLLSLNLLKAWSAPQGSGEEECEEQREGERTRTSALQKVLAYFEPSVNFLGNWMSLWLVPPVVMLPRAVQSVRISSPTVTGKALVWAKVLVVHFGLWVAANAVTAGIYKSIDDACSPQLQRQRLASAATTQDDENENDNGGGEYYDDIDELLCGGDDAMAKSPPRSPIRKAKRQTQQTVEDNVRERLRSPLPHPPKRDVVLVDPQGDDGLSSTPSAADATEVSSYRDAATNATANATTTASANATASAGLESSKREKQLQLIRFWGVVSAGFYAAAGMGAVGTSPALAATSITAMSAGMAMPARVKKVLHPLFFTAIVSAIATVLTDKIRRRGGLGGRGGGARSWVAALSAFTQGAEGDVIAPGAIFSFLLGPSCTALAFRILQQQETVGKKLPAVLGAAVGGALASLLLSPAVGRLLGLPPDINGVLAHRGVTTPLALPSAEQAGLSPELTVAAVVVTGLYGASGEWLLEKLGLARKVPTAASAAEDASTGDDVDSDTSSATRDQFEHGAARGSIVGTTSHSLGTAALLSAGDTDAAGVASVAMLVAGISHAAFSTVPRVRSLVRALAGLKPH